MIHCDENYSRHRCSRLRTGGTATASHLLTIGRSEESELHDGAASMRQQFREAFAKYHRGASTVRITTVPTKL